jgi:hypothetical protein
LFTLVACSQRPEVATRLAAQGGPSPGESFWNERTVPVPDGGVDPNPPGRRATALAYDPEREVAVLYGGRNEDPTTPVLSDTWEWSSFTRTWEKVLTSGNPGPRYGHAMVWIGDRMILFGGRDQNDDVSDETWEYTVTPRAWSRLDFDAGHRPSARYEHAMAVASAGSLNGAIVQGGRDPGAESEMLDDTWYLASLSTGWVNVTHVDRPPARYRHAMAWDDAADRLVLFGGDTDAAGAGELGDTWTSVTSAGTTGPLVRWVKHSEGMPSARERARFVWYDTFHRGLLYGGSAGGGETWRWSGGGWTQDSPDGSPPSLAGHAMTFDSSRRLVLLFGGSPAVKRTWEYRIDNRPSIDAPDGAGDEAELLALDIVGSDAIDDTQLLTLSLTDVDPTPAVPVVMPSVMGTGEVTGHLAWTPSCNDHGAYTLTFSLTDGVQTETAESTVTIADVNCLPVFADLGPQTFEEGEPGGFTVSASDPENGKVTLSLDPVTMPRTPDVAPSFDGTTGMVTWTPGPSDSGTYTFTFRATDPGGAAARKDVTVTVGDVASPPVLELPGAQTIAEGALGSFMVSASDPDGGEVTVTFVDLLPAPEVAPSFSAGIFSWTPGFLDDGVYTATFRASDGGAPVDGTVSITVTDSNRPPSVVLTPAGLMKMTSEGHELRFTVAALDPDADDQLTLTSPSLPPGALFDGAVFTWTPDSTRGSTGGTPYMAVFAVSDGTAMVMTTVTLTVFDVNQPPVVTPIPPKTIAEGGTLSFTVSATDPDGGSIRFSARALPPGASFDATTRTFTWSPGCTAADTSPMTSARLVASDGIDEVEIVVPITVTGTVVLASPASLSFPSTRVGASAAPLALSVMNGASQPLRVLSMTSGASVFPLSVTGALPRTLGADEVVFAQVGFMPVAQTVSASAITITVEDPACPTLTVPVTGAGQASGLSVSRSGADFGPVRVGGLSPSVSFTVTNVGEASFTVQSVALTGDDFVLTLVSPAASGYPVLVPMDGIVSFTVTGAPASLGLRTGSVAIATDIPGAPLTSLPLSVVGVTPDLSVTPSEIAFGAVDIRGAAATRELVLSNTGQVAISVARPTVTGPGASAYRVLGGTATTVLDPGETASFTVSYTPAAESSGEAAASVQVAIGSLSIGVPLSGRGADRHLGTPDAPVIFARTRVGDQRTQVVTLRNTGEAPLLLADVHTDGCADFSDDVASAVTVPALGTREVAVRFQPTATGARACDLVVESDDAARPVARIALEGTGGGGLALAPAMLQAGAVAGRHQQAPHARGQQRRQRRGPRRARLRAPRGRARLRDRSRLHPRGLAGRHRDRRRRQPDGACPLRPDEARAYQADVRFFVAGQTLPDEVPVSGTGSDDILLTGGGCRTGGGEAGWPAALVVLALLLRRPRGGHPRAAPRRRRRAG